MRVLVTGHDGYIGAVMVPMLQAAGHEIVGLDSQLFEDCTFGDYEQNVHTLRLDIRDVQLEHLIRFDAVIHLAGISNDPLGNLDPACTYAINHAGSIRLARLSKKAGIGRFIFSSSCSLYGAAASDRVLDETAPFNPVTPYGKSKVLVEQDLAGLADDDFSPILLRNATVYGVSPRLRVDLVVNNLVGFAVTTGHVLIMSDGTPWRPLIHVEDIAQAFLAVLEAPQGLVHNQAFNVGANHQNYQIREVAGMVAEIVPNSTVMYAPDGEPDLRSYRVDFSKLSSLFPDFQPRWTLRRGIEQLLSAFQRHNLTREQFLGSLYLRLDHVKRLLAEGHIDSNLRRISSPYELS